MTDPIRASLNQPVILTDSGMRMGEMEVSDEQTIRIGGVRKSLPARHLRLVADHIRSLIPGGHPPQVSLLAFNLTGDLRTLDHYFPLAQGLPPKKRTEFLQSVDRLAGESNLKVTLKAEHRRNRSAALPAGIRHLLAGMILEALYFRLDLMEAFLQQRKQFRFYTSIQALRDDGGIGGGCYHPGKRIMQLVLSRLWEGYDHPAPGSSPFLHEFGHMLDAFDAVSGRLGTLDGMLPSMDDAAVEAFKDGKTIELERYRACQLQPQADRARQPLGHPYVFQNDREFLAGYFEMFFRNPHTFASRNPNLYRAFMLTLRQDPREWLKADYTGYLNTNFLVYNVGKDVPPPKIHLV